MTSVAAAAAGGADDRQDVSHGDETAVRLVLDLLYAPMPWIMRVLGTIHFRRLQVRNADRFPARGPVILVANHPSTWMDVLVLEIALRRKLHFLAHETLFRPRPRGWFLRLFGTLPVAMEGPDHAARNAATFLRCTDLLGRGEVVALFPEGVSADDRSLRPFHAGATRIALDHLDAGGRVPIVPVGIHYVDRTAFREDVIVSVGEPLWLAPRSIPTPPERTAWIAAVTARLHCGVAGLIDLRDVAKPQPTPMTWMVVLLGTPIGTAGLLLNALPALVTKLSLAGQSDPARIALTRVLGGLAFFTTWYLGLAVIPALGPWPGWAGVVLAAGAALLGAFTLVWMDGIRALRRRNGSATRAEPSPGQAGGEGS